jgi:hypothetical protein
MADMETCVKHKVPIIITSLRPPLMGGELMRQGAGAGSAEP